MGLTYLLYLGRWQLSTPILAIVVGLVAGWQGAVLANLIGGLIFFWVDRFIFRKGCSCESLQPVQRGSECDACGLTSASYAEGTVGG